MVIAIMLQMCTRLGLIKCKRQGEPLPQGYRTPWCRHLGSLEVVLPKDLH